MNRYSVERLPFKTGSFSFLLYRGMNGDSERLIIFPRRHSELVVKSKCVPKAGLPHSPSVPDELSLLLSPPLCLCLSVCLSLWSELGTDPDFKVAGEYRLTWIIHLLSLRVMEEDH